jgi:hypothetical protein
MPEPVLEDEILRNIILEYNHPAAASAPSPRLVQRPRTWCTSVGLEIE